MDAQKQELVEKLKGANNILVTVSSNPSVDQLAACIGVTLLLNKLNKHGTAVFSGKVPSTIEFLKPEETIEKNTDSLQDFIISLDKSKADKLRYKVEDAVVKIFITPYRTSIGESDLNFSQGDFNVDVVLCLGVQQQEDLDQAITSHGRILHDAVVTAINTHTGNQLGTINWVDPAASSLSELAASLVDDLGKDLMDEQIATAFLTGIVAETARFSNERTTPETMRISAELMAAGANQQLVASELQSPEKAADVDTKSDDSSDDGTPPTEHHDGSLEIDHPVSEGSDDTKDEPPVPVSDSEQNQPQPAENENADTSPEEASEPDSSNDQPTSRIILQPPSMGGILTASGQDEDLISSVDPLTPPTNDDQPATLSHGQNDNQSAAGIDENASELETSSPDRALDYEPSASEPPEKPAQLDLPAPAPISDEGTTSELPFPAAVLPFDAANQTLADVENIVDSPHASPSDNPASQLSNDNDDTVDSARGAVEDAMNTAMAATPAQSNTAGYLDVHDLPNDQPSVPQPGQPTSQLPALEPAPGISPADKPLNMPPPPPFVPLAPTDDDKSPTPPDGQVAPPPVPPPMTELPPFMGN